jgi:Zc3h12a-like Ribonuclease NYN domain
MSVETATEVGEESVALWKERLAQIPPKDLLRLVGGDKGRARFLFQGFRETEQAVKNPIVQQRIAELAQAQPLFGGFLATLARDFQTARVKTESDAEEIADNPEVAKLNKQIEMLNANLETQKKRIEEQKSQIKEKASKITQLEASEKLSLKQLTQIDKERAQLHTERESERKAHNEALAEIERLRRQHERDLRKEAPTESQKEKAVAKAAVKPTANLIVPVVVNTGVWDVALERLLNQGKYNAVVDICREVLLQTTLPAMQRAPLHKLTAAALYAQGEEATGEQEDYQAALVYLDAGQVVPAAECFARALSHGPQIAMRPVEKALLQRLQALAQKLGGEEEVKATFSRLRITSRQGYQRLRNALNKSGKQTVGLLSEESDTPITLLLPDENIALPTKSRLVASVSARRLVQAVEAGEEAFVLDARTGLDALRAENPTLAEALFQAVHQLLPNAIVPLTNPLTRPVIVDASNIARYNPDPMLAPTAPLLQSVLLMRDFLLQRGFFPVLLIADANLRHLVQEKAHYADLVERHVIQEAPPRTSADEILLRLARQHMAPVVTNDAFADHPEEARRIERIGFDLYRNRIVLDPR